MIMKVAVTSTRVSTIEEQIMMYDGCEMRVIKIFIRVAQ